MDDRRQHRGSSTFRRFEKFDKEHLLEIILSPDNMNKAYKAFVRNKGKGGIDKMSCEQLLPWLLTNKDELIKATSM